MDEASVQQFPKALEHGDITQIFENVFFVTGAMETVLMDMDWKFSRNMTIVREGERLIIINSVRLNEAGLAQLDKLGRVSDVVRLGALHGRDDAFYIDRYKAKYWGLPGFPGDADLALNELSAHAALPISNASLFTFGKAKLPEAILFLPQEGGIAIACDALQNWLSPDAYFCDSSVARMEQMGFFTPANIGPVWMQAAEPEKDDFDALSEIAFEHALCGHGEPLINGARDAYKARFKALFSQ